MIRYNNEWKCPRCPETFPTPASMKAHWEDEHRELGASAEEVAVFTPDIPRRARRDKWTAAERLIQAAVDSVEEMGCHIALTDAVVLLGRARDRVADFVDQQIATTEAIKNGLHGK